MRDAQSVYMCSTVTLSQKRADEIFRDININVNGFYVMNYLAYYSLRLGGWVAWRGHRKTNAKIPGLK